MPSLDDVEPVENIEQQTTTVTTSSGGETVSVATALGTFAYDPSTGTATFVPASGTMTAATLTLIGASGAQVYSGAATVGSSTGDIGDGGYGGNIGTEGYTPGTGGSSTAAAWTGLNLANGSYQAFVSYTVGGDTFGAVFGFTVGGSSVVTGLRTYRAGSAAFCAAGADGDHNRASAWAVCYLYVPIRAQMSGSSYDPSGQNVFLRVGNGDDPPDWVAADWFAGADGTWYACALIGPGQEIAPGYGCWDVEVKVEDSPQAFVSRADYIALD